MKIVSREEKYHLADVTKLLLNPSTNRKKRETSRVVMMKPCPRWRWLTWAMMMGMRGINPNTTKLKKVTRLLRRGFSSSAISCSSSIIMTLRKPSLFDDRISTISQATRASSPISLYMCTISSFSDSQSASISARSRTSSAFMYSSSLLVARQSATAMEMASPMRDASPKARMQPGARPEPMPDRATLRVVMSPSRPPQTADLMYSPALMCFSSPTCSSRRSSASVIWLLFIVQSQL